ncbi:MAG TPA: response regulator transcription factor [Candidatus Brachybacterium merdavium]|uniref:Response regulator transcription factor n=1 Tax=Candidatus Brachybacterium merdavium TaxID=2838513 RepID=A0A9D2LBJ0_9MICO|nr:response regulator transcription factor [Candidatus Brachybacterium merdavium]
MSDPIRVLVADDHPAVLSGLVTLLDSAPDITVVAQAVDGTSALRAAQQHRPDVVLTDVRMPGATGIDITPRLRGTGASVLVISGFDLDEYVLGALAAGADGYLVKSEDPARILAAVRDVHRGDAVLSPAATRAVVSALHEAEAPGSSPARTSGRAPGEADPASGPRGNSGSGPGSGSASGPGSGPAMIPAFTRREEEVLAFLAQGLSNQQIASKMFVEISTVKSHISHVLNKLGLDSRVQAALWWQQNRD